jgi:hypothetical protein
VNDKIYYYTYYHIKKSVRRLEDREEEGTVVTHLCRWGDQCDYQTTVMKSFVEHINTSHVQVNVHVCGGMVW